MSPRRNPDPRASRADTVLHDAAACAGAAGDHERPHDTGRCRCACHVDPWPFEHADG